MGNDLIGNSRVRREEQRLFINRSEIHGIQAINANWDNNLTVLKYLGARCAQIIPGGAGQSNFTISTFVIDYDPFLNLTGNSGINGYIIRSKTDTTNNYGFTSGYLTSYRSKCSIGEIPQIEAGFTVYGRAGRILSTDAPEVAGDLASFATYDSNFYPNIAGPGSILLNLGEFSGNRLQSYDFSFNIQRQPQYILGQRMPNRVEINYPIELNFSFVFEADSYIPRRMFDFPCSPQVQPIEISYNNYVSRSEE